MTNNIPAGLKYADIRRFAMMAAQIEKVNPVVAYWCEPQYPPQCCNGQLELTESSTSQFKSHNRNNETVIDGIAASALVGHFGLEVFTHAEAAMDANKVTEHTADSFQAASLFLELCQIWGAPGPNIARRIKFGKYHAVRIVKAIKNGEDPNATNTVPKEEEQESITAQEIQVFDESVAEQASRPTQPPIEQIPVESNHLGVQLAQQASPDVPPHLPRESSLLRPPVNSMLDIASVLRNAPGFPVRRKDINNSQPGDSEVLSTPRTIGGSSSVPNLPDIPEADKSRHPKTLHPFPPAAASSSSAAVRAPASFHRLSSANAHISDPASLLSRSPSISRSRVASAAAAPPSQPLQSADDQSISLAQKHAHWALSALTFEDVDTAVKEFKNSLRLLGAAC
ncbi:hypothetical protein PENFLA_c066G00242 [Penicillium flavigenum]|uniref:Vta1 C-terminal domain-containing protein n=1 Tax=Penicillium flavigenum TaxID=254877 RepID=A0A1V6SD72_9EURO|nr:hypothetical protein PENFLA_c066G00242 [Penicillium flavigenum]